MQSAVQQVLDQLVASGAGVPARPIRPDEMSRVRVMKAVYTALG